MPAPTATTTPGGEYLRQLRHERGENQTELADVLGVSQATVSRCESGDRPMTPELALRLITRIGVDVDEVARYVPLPGLRSHLTSGLATSRTNGPSPPQARVRTTTLRHGHW